MSGLKDVASTTADVSEKNAYAVKNKLETFGSEITELSARFACTYE
jgi:hypothetical protein